MKHTGTQTRLQSLDALRGFDMCWIISGEFIVHAWAKADDNPVIGWMSSQLHHSDWNGFTFYDMIFPLFIFIAGVSMPYSFAQQLAKAGGDRGVAKRNIYRALLKRTVILIFLGMVVNGLLQWKGYEYTRFASVLGRIALSCFLAACIFLNCRLRGQIIWCLALLIGYWAAMLLIPVPGFGAGVLTPEGNLAAWVDRMWLPGKLHRKVYDPEGLLSTIPAIASALLGIFTGQFLRWQPVQWKSHHKVEALVVAGIALLLLGKLWDIVFPINKIIWTSSFVLYAGGWSLLLLALFYGLIDVAGFKKWSLPFTWIGLNSILIYMAVHGIINFESTAQFLFGGWIKYAPEASQPVWLWTGVALIQLTLLYFLYRKKWFLKV
jgi:predicted acyltransferase